MCRWPKGAARKRGQSKLEIAKGLRKDGQANHNREGTQGLSELLLFGVELPGGKCKNIYYLKGKKNPKKKSLFLCSPLAVKR